MQMEVIFEEKRLRLAELLEYNKRLDKIILLYITAVYSVIGLRFADKLELSKLSSSIDSSYLLFLFVFLNLSIILHAISQASFAMSLAKFVHIRINSDIKKIIEENSQTVPSYTLSWDDWNTEIKNVAVRTRDGVVALWILLVISVSIYSIKIINISDFYENNHIECILIIISLSLYLLYIIYNAISLMYFSSKFHVDSDEIEAPKKLLWLYSIIITLLIILLTTLMVQG